MMMNDFDEYRKRKKKKKRNEMTTKRNALKMKN